MSVISTHTFFDKPTFTLTHVVWDRATRDAVVIDPVLDFDPATQLVTNDSMLRLANFLKSENLRVHWVLDTHAHADHLSSSRELKAGGYALGWGMSERMNDVFNTFTKVFAWPKTLRLEQLGVDRWLRDGEEFTAGSLRIETIATPGHTSACTTFRVGEKLFTGDALFMPDSGVGRCDFPGGSARTLYASVWGKLYRYPDNFEVYVGHDYMPSGRPLRYQTTVGEEKLANIHLRASTSEEEFVKFREARDKTLSAPRLLNPALDWNLGANVVVKRPMSLIPLANHPQP